MDKIPEYETHSHGDIIDIWNSVLSKYRSEQDAVKINVSEQDAAKINVSKEDAAKINVSKEDAAKITKYVNEIYGPNKDITTGWGVRPKSLESFKDLIMAIFMKMKSKLDHGHDITEYLHKIIKATELPPYGQMASLNVLYVDLCQEDYTESTLEDFVRNQIMEMQSQVFETVVIRRKEGQNVPSYRQYKLRELIGLSAEYGRGVGLDQGRFRKSDGLALQKFYDEFMPESIAEKLVTKINKSKWLDDALELLPKNLDQDASHNDSKYMEKGLVDDLDQLNITEETLMKVDAEGLATDDGSVDDGEFVTYEELVCAKELVADKESIDAGELANDDEELLRDFDQVEDAEENGIYEGDVNPAFESRELPLDPSPSNSITREKVEEAVPTSTDNNLNLPSITIEQVVEILVKMNFLTRNQNSTAEKML